MAHPQSGDLCRLLPGYRVEHYRCDEYQDGTITDVVAGQIIFQPVGTPVGFSTPRPTNR